MNRFSYDEWHRAGLCYKDTTPNWFVLPPEIIPEVRETLNQKAGWEQIIRRLPIQLSDFQLKLKSSGVVTMLCVFHCERTPSLWLRSTSFHCYGCGESGDKVTFAQRIYSFVTLQDVEWFFSTLPSPLPKPGQQAILFS